MPDVDARRQRHTQISGREPGVVGLAKPYRKPTIDGQLDGDQAKPPPNEGARTRARRWRESET